MRKIKLFSFLLTFNLFCANYVFAKSEDLKQTKINELKIEKDVEKDSEIGCNITEKEKEKYYVKGYKITQIVKKDIFKIVCYEHEISGAQFLVFYDNLKYLNIDPQALEFSKGKLFFKCYPPVNIITLKGLCNYLNRSLKQRLKTEFCKTELRQLGFYCNEYFKVADHDKGCGIYLDFFKYDKKFFKCIADVVQYATWHKNRKFVDASLNATKEDLAFFKNSNKVLQNRTLSPELYDRFSFGKFSNFKKEGELEKLQKNEQFLMNSASKLFSPSHTLIKINARQNLNYKEIMKEIDKNYFSSFENKEKTNKTYEKKIIKYMEKQPYREIELDSNSVVVDAKANSFEGLSEKSAKKCKYQAKLFWDISKMPIEERVVFFTKPQIYLNFLKEEIKKMGYIGVFSQTDINYTFANYNSIIFDGLYYIDIYGFDRKCFEKEKLEENGQKLVKMLYEKIKELSDQELLTSVYNDDTIIPEIEDELNYINSTKYLSLDFDDFFTKSYCLTNNPFHRKYFTFKNGRKIEFKTKDFVDSFRKYNNRFEMIYNSKPIYIDFFVANNKKDEEKNKYYRYLNPFCNNDICYNDSAMGFKEYYLFSMIYDLIYNKFYKPNLIDKGLIAKDGLNSKYFEIRLENLEEVEKYLFNKFKEEIKDFVPKKDEFENLKSSILNDLKAEFKERNITKKEYEDILNSDVKFKKCEKTFKKEQHNLYKTHKVLAKSYRKSLKDKKEKKSNSKEIEFFKKELRVMLKYIKEFEENIKKPNYFVDEVKKFLNFNIKIMSNDIKRSLDRMQALKNLTYEDFVKYYKNLKFSSSNHLKKCKN